MMRVEASNPVIGTITCGQCGNPATVHVEKKGMRSMYIRCYQGSATDPRDYCGTIQCRYPGGQRFIRENMRPLTLPEQDKAVQEAALSVSAVAHEAAQEGRRKSRLWSFLSEGDEG